MTSFGKTDTGIKRDNNQDSIFLSDSPVGPLPNLYIVADGMGGHAAGDFASQYAIRLVVDFVKKSTIENPLSLMKRAFIYASNEVYKEAEKDKYKNGMGTTMVAAVLIGKELYVGNIGDSRLYVVGNDIKQITMDHSLVEELIRNGQLDRNKGRNHPEKNIITRAMGSRDEVMPDFFQVTLEDNDKVMLCSDGLTNMVEDDEIRDIIGEDDDPRRMVDSLISRANYYGGNDNISVIVISASER
ncbi:MAG: Stp1/IreP family PP2C-type Ser/Thr phosphatase [Eubacterium sp.]|nr:Stp1/IreP family PP2C-type Ser/Thr phosphatase [Eubacterium sp.]MBR6218769.1 Stp1/IreP family PP2C-type Ser/Thr phosphatase [Eubacterium sp.]